MKGDWPSLERISYFTLNKIYIKHNTNGEKIFFILNLFIKILFHHLSITYIDTAKSEPCLWQWNGPTIAFYFTWNRELRRLFVFVVWVSIESLYLNIYDITSQISKKRTNLQKKPKSPTNDRCQTIRKQSPGETRHFQLSDRHESTPKWQQGRRWSIAARLPGA